ncbi:leucine-rich repeat domain-containing protein [Cytophagaceae bacterium YF14B1]|uniref:Leucine-rich repeat domain-containing protein n=1 Tax=Xanthocytophaga flava TaxID=3048013 RepID=A0AAE3QQI3_9BACT|nr:leucine-rich repeat domain-containing protein [Xanthocytophaga flavus]MDJ1480893.1 leucine-rich repeat domain-containing protein [Xanthocytophaga flavus]
METDKLIQLFESPDPANIKLAFHMMTLKSEATPLPQPLQEAAALGLETILPKPKTDDSLCEDIWNWITHFQLPVTHSDRIKDWLLYQPDKCLYHNIKEIFPLIRQYGIGNTLPDYPLERLWECTNLEFLNFQFIQLPPFPIPAKVFFPHLKDLRFYEFQAEPEFYTRILAGSPNLSKLSFIQTNLSRFPGEITQMYDLEDFDLYGNKSYLTETIRIPDEIRNLQKMKRFSCRYFRLAEFPKAVVQMPFLESLALPGTECAFQIPDEIENLTRLESVFLEGNYFEEFPEALTRLPSLQTIQIGEGIQRIPLSITNLSSLKALLLYGVEFDELPPYLADMPNLNTFWIITSRKPFSIEKLPSLTNLSITSCKLTVFPSTIVDTIQLEDLTISYNEITEIPTQFNQLVNLKHLHINNNNITRLPDELFELENLVYLSIGNNPLTEISPRFQQLKNLRVLNMTGMSLSDEGVAIVRSWIPYCQLSINDTHYPALK